MALEKPLQLLTSCLAEALTECKLLNNHNLQSQASSFSEIATKFVLSISCRREETKSQWET